MKITETVTIKKRIRSGYDEFGEPIYSYEAISVDGVLVRQLDGRELDGAERPDGIKVEYVLAFNEAFDASHLDGASCFVRGSNSELKVGRVVVVPQSPLKWKCLAYVGRADG